MKITDREIERQIEELEATLNPKPMLFKYEDEDGKTRLIGIDEYEAIAEENNYSFFLSISNEGGDNMEDFERHLKIITEHANRH